MLSYSKIVVALIIVLNAIFTAAVLWIFAITSVEPVALIGAWFAFTTGELWLIAGIKKSKVKAKSELQKIKERKVDCGEDVG
jgi:hypothetical protein